MIKDFIELARAFGASAATESPAISDSEGSRDRIAAAHQLLTARMQQMVPLRELIESLPETSPERQQLRALAEQEAQEILDALREFSSSDDLDTALVLAEYVSETLSEELGPNHPYVVDAILCIGQLQYARGNYYEAENAAQRGRDVASFAGPSLQDRAAYFHLLLGTIAFDQGLFIRAIESYQQAINACDPSTSGSRYLVAFRNLARAHRAAGDIVNAKTAFEAILKAQQPVLPADSLELAATKSELAAVIAETGDYATALPLLEEALATYRSHLPESRDAFASALHAVVRVSEGLGQDAEAAVYRRELASYLTVDHPDYYLLTNEEITNLLDHNSLEGAHAKLRDISWGAARKFGIAHPKFAAICENWGRLYLLTGNYDAAKRAYRRAQAAYEMSAGPGSPHYLHSIAALGHIALARGNLHEAGETLRPLLTIRSETADIRPEINADIQAALGEFFQLSGDFESALKRYIQQLVIVERAYGRGHYRAAIARNNVAIASLELNVDPQEVKPLLDESYQIIQQQVGLDHRMTRAVANNLAVVCIRAQELDTAENLLEELVRSDELGGFSPALAINNLGCLHQARGESAASLMMFRRAVIDAEGEAIQPYELGIMRLNEACLLAALGQIAEAEESFILALQLLEHSVGVQHPDYVLAENSLNELKGGGHGKLSATRTLMMPLIAA